jgi:hypothetical protein
MSVPAASIVNTPLAYDALPASVGAPTSALTQGVGSDCALTLSTGCEQQENLKTDDDS